MPYSATVHRLLISSPGDVNEDDVASVMRAVARWNVVYGRAFVAVVVPLHWDLHAAAEHGVRPQASINAQLCLNLSRMPTLCSRFSGRDSARRQVKRRA
jgi:hypothetical protein